MKKYDVILIGTGSANIIADAAITQGLSVAIVERGSFGGTCLNRGCIPRRSWSRQPAASVKSAKAAASASLPTMPASTGIF